MAFTLYQEGQSLAIQAASAINPFQPVKLVGTSSLFAVPAATSTDVPFGFNGEATAGASGINSVDAAAIYSQGNVAKAVCAASVGVGSEVGVASTNGALGPIAGASGVSKWSVGIALTPAAPGERLSVYVRPRQLGGLS